MERRRDSSNSNLPSNPLFTNPDPYMEELLHGLVNSSRQSQTGDNQVNFDPWSAYSEEGPFQQADFMNWNAFQPTLDLSSAARSDSRNSNNSPLTTGPYNLGSDDFLHTLRTERPRSESADGVYSGVDGLLFANNKESLHTGAPNLGAAAESGRQLYGDALNQWMNFTGKTYDPFGKTEVFSPEASENAETRRSSSASESVYSVDSGAAAAASSSPASTKPSYSDVARNQRTVSGAHGQGRAPRSAPNTPPIDESKVPDFHNISPHLLRSQGCRHKSSRGHKPRSPTMSGSDRLSSVGRFGGNSRMGLDNFDDQAMSWERVRQQTSCSDGSNPQSRKGSTSSIGSGSSGVDDFNYLLQSHISAGATGSTVSPDVLGGGEAPLFDNSGLDSKKSDVTDTSMQGTFLHKNKSKMFHKTQASSRPRAATTPQTPPQPGSSRSKGDDEACSSNAKKKAFFDPKRIFDQKSAVAAGMPQKSSGLKGGAANHPKHHKGNNQIGTDGIHIPNNQNHGSGSGSKEKSSSGSSVLNNGKPKSNLYASTNVHAKPAATHYINNDLRQPSKKQTNTEGRNSPNRTANKSTNTGYGEPAPPDTGESSKDHPQTSCPPQSDVKSPGPPPGLRRKQDHLGKKSADPRPHSKRSRRHRESSVSHRSKYGELLVHSWEWFKWMCKELMQHATNIVLLVLKVTLALAAVGLSGVVSVLNQSWQWLKMKVPYLRRRFNPEENESFDWNGQSSQSRIKNIGLEKNITLPTTGEEAMKRLLACKGKDPYSILGVRMDTPDEEIKRYYRKQAVLVHPDKNKIPGAEEAFKILGHSFDIIGEPEKRQKYDAQRLETQETETAMHEFADLLTKLRSKMQEAVNLMRCEKCGGRHRRVPTDRPWYNARFCDRCNVRHSAKEGDVWAESRVMGFLWHYYACMEGKIYDITEWASCQSGNFKHIQANAHHVIYRIATQAGARQRSQSNSGRGNSEPDLEEFINHLFHRSGRTDSTESPSQNPASNPAAAAAAAASASAKKRRKKKGKH